MPIPFDDIDILVLRAAPHREKLQNALRAALTTPDRDEAERVSAEATRAILELAAKLVFHHELLRNLPPVPPSTRERELRKIQANRARLGKVLPRLSPWTEAEFRLEYRGPTLYPKPLASPSPDDFDPKLVTKTVQRLLAEAVGRPSKVYAFGEQVFVSAARVWFGCLGSLPARSNYPEGLAPPSSLFAAVVPAVKAMTSEQHLQKQLSETTYRSAVKKLALAGVD